MSGTILSQIIPFIFLPIITRLYSVDAIGIFSVFTSILIITSVVSSGRYEQAILLSSNDNEKEGILNVCFVFTLLFTILSLFVVCIFSLYLVDFYKVYYLLPLAILLLGVYQALNSYHIKGGKFKAISISKVIVYGGLSVSQVSMYYFIDNEIGLTLGFILGYVGGATYLLKKGGLKFNTEKNSLKQLANRYINFPLINSWSALLNSGTANLPTMIFGYFYGVSTAAFIALAFKVVQVPISVISGAISQVYYKKISDNIDNLAFLKLLTIRTQYFLVFISIVPLVLVNLYSEVLFEIVFGAEWKDAGIYAACLSNWIVFIFCASHITLLFNVYEMHKTQLIFNIFSFVTRTVPVLYLAFEGGSVIDSVFAYTLFSVIFWLVQINYILGRVLKFTLIDLFKANVSIGFLPLFFLLKSVL